MGVVRVGRWRSKYGCTWRPGNVAALRGGTMPRYKGSVDKEIVLGVDPSTDGLSYAVAVGADGLFLPVSPPGRRGRLSPASIEGAVRLRHCTVAAIELPAQLYAKGAVARAVLSASATGGVLHGWLARSGAVREVAAVAPEEWRKWLTGRRNPTDKQVKAALAARGVLPPRSNPHLRDALGVALYVQAGGRSVLHAKLHWRSGVGWP